MYRLAHLKKSRAFTSVILHIRLLMRIDSERMNYMILRVVYSRFSLYISESQLQRASRSICFYA